MFTKIKNLEDTFKGSSVSNLFYLFSNKLCLLKLRPLFSKNKIKKVNEFCVIFKIRLYKFQCLKMKLSTLLGIQIKIQSLKNTTFIILFYKFHIIMYSADGIFLKYVVSLS